jgi:SPP1 gp7 family putative phage head morphogenesis protein
LNDLYNSPLCCGIVPVDDLADNPIDWDAIYDAITKQLLETDENFNFDLYEQTATELVRAMESGLKFSSTASEDDMMKLQRALRVNLFEFSSAKAQTMMLHYRELMMNQKREIISFESLRKIVANEGEIFNNNYLKTEYNLTKQAAIMAVKWQELDAEYLQFSTVGDDRVRPEHKLFDKFTALKTDAIWKRLYTPLDWGCRCTIIPGKETGLNKTYNSDWANKMVDPLVKNTMFDNNVGITLEIFNKKHPYYSK